MKVLISESRDQAIKLADPYEYVEKKLYFELKPCNTFPNSAYMPG